MSTCMPMIAATAGALLLSAAAARAEGPSVQFGSGHAVALRNNGDVLTWGSNQFCQLGRPTTGESGISGAPTLVMRNVKETAVAVTHNFALTTDGKVYAWGANPDGTLGMGNSYEQCEGPALVPSLADKTIAHISTGYGFAVAVSSNGDLYCAGDNSMSQCPVSKSVRSDVFLPVPFPELAGQVQTVAAGTFHTLVMTKNGKLYAFGRGRDGQLGPGPMANGFRAIPDLTAVVSLAAGTWHSGAVTADGTVWLWGNDSRSQLCDGLTASLAVPMRVALPGQARATAVYASGHTTVIRAADGALYGCGDNQSGLLGVDAQLILPRPEKLPIQLGSGGRFSMSGANAAVSADGCAVRMAGLDDLALLSEASAPQRGRVFSPRANLTLCGTRLSAPQPTLVREYPKGGESGCWTPRVEEDAAKSAKWLPARQALLAAEDILKRNAVFMAAPVPSRFRTSLGIGPSNESGARMHVKVAPERKPDLTRLWTGTCDVIPQIDRIGGAIAQVSIFMNVDARGNFIGPGGEPPKLTGRAGGYPEYNHWVLITKDNRVPWIPQTLADRLDVVGQRREDALADWKRGGGPSRNPAYTAELEKQLADYKAYRASFTPELLRAPAVLGDRSGEEKRRSDAKIAALRALAPEEQRQVDEWSGQSRALERQAQTEIKNKNADEAARLRAQANDLANKVRGLRTAHQDRIAPEIDDLTAQYVLANLRPGPADQAIGVKPDPTLPNFADPNRIQLITVIFSEDPDPRQAERRAWQQRIKETFDFSALAALLK